MNLRPLVVTGAIGSGKSTVSKLLEDFGAHRVDLDQLSREVLETESGQRFVEVNWPWVTTDSGIDRAALARIVFTNASELQRLEQFVHPLVMSEFRARYAWLSPLAVEVSVPFSITIDNGFVVLVDTPEDGRFERLMHRGMASEDISARLASQAARFEWLKLADAVVSNQGPETELRRDVESFWVWWTEARL